MYPHLVQFNRNHPGFDVLQTLSPAQNGISRFVGQAAAIKAAAYRENLEARLDRSQLTDTMQQQAAHGSRFWFLTSVDSRVQDPLAFMRTTERSANLTTIDEVLTHPDYTRKGLGSLLVRNAITRTFNLDHTTVIAQSNDASPHGAAFYGSIGFSEHSDPSQAPEQCGDSTASGHATLYSEDVRVVLNTIEAKYPWMLTF